jgi:predicted nuclease of predicted toxin-antitoxin system
MAKPRFLTNHDFNENIPRGVERLEANVEFLRLREIGFEEKSDPEILEYASQNGWIVLSHDVNTMSAAAFSRIKNRQPMCGLLLAHQTSHLGPIIDNLLLIWSASELEEWHDRVFFLPF